MRVLVLAGLLLAVLAYGIIANVGAGAPQGFTGADCFHVDATGDPGPCADAPEPEPHAAVAAANWEWWGPAAAPVLLAAIVLAVWLRIRRVGCRRAAKAVRAT
ncbi:hypothetical protein SAMN05216298_3498 [Glycomyces sambucus]|uniref:Uncharacterized protein n=1 Tax=Glycomyces sambucus TaxID=380244 RepID=A0A1G9J9L0_9ACTN|nr:hypothetical protein [Glycomyces sambucus]SDL33972.1 hypothetical protein SAMN05216298_3498 [Glycomyces sambucus]